MSDMALPMPPKGENVAECLRALGFLGENVDIGDVVIAIPEDGYATMSLDVYLSKAQYAALFQLVAGASDEN